MSTWVYAVCWRNYYEWRVRAGDMRMFSNITRNMNNSDTESEKQDELQQAATSYNRAGL